MIWQMLEGEQKGRRIRFEIVEKGVQVVVAAAVTREIVGHSKKSPLLCRLAFAVVNFVHQKPSFKQV